jgi:hypothetical protein
MYTFTNTNPIHYVQHHTNTKPSTNAIKHHHLHTGSHLPTHGQNCNQTREPLGSYSTNLRPQDLYGLDYTQNTNPHTRVHTKPTTPHTGSPKKSPPQTHHSKPSERKKEKREAEREREEKKQRERVKARLCRAKILHHWWR